MEIFKVFTFVASVVSAVVSLKDVTERGHYRLSPIESSNKYYWFEVYEAVNDGKPAWPIWPQFAHVKQYCADMKMKLPFPRSLEENDFLGSVLDETWPETIETLSNTAGFYVDLTDEGVEGEWRNSAGELVWYGDEDGSEVEGQWTNWNVNEPNDSGSDDEWAVAMNGHGPWLWKDVDDDSKVYSRFFVCEGIGWHTICLDRNAMDIPVDIGSEVTVTFNLENETETTVYPHDTLTFECPSEQFVVIDGKLLPAQKAEFACQDVLLRTSIECQSATPTCTIPKIEYGQLELQQTLPGNVILENENVIFKEKEFNINCDEGYVAAAEANGLSSFSCVAQDQFNVEPRCLRECPSTFIPNGGLEGLKVEKKFIEGFPIKRTCVSGMRPSIKEDAVCLPFGTINKKHECISVPDNTPVIAGAVGGTLIVVLLGVGYIVYQKKKRSI